MTSRMFQAPVIHCEMKLREAGIKFQDLDDLVDEAVDGSDPDQLRGIIETIQMVILTS